MDAGQQRLGQAFLGTRDFPDASYPEAAGSRIRAYHPEHHTVVYRRDPGTVTILRIVNSPKA